eukprot:8111983-Pyramimonas_sp.AAC.1
MAATAQPGTTSCCSRRGVPCGRMIPTPPARPPVGPRKPGGATIVLAGNMVIHTSVSCSDQWVS